MRKARSQTSIIRRMSTIAMDGMVRTLKAFTTSETNSDTISIYMDLASRSSLLTIPPTGCTMHLIMMYDLLSRNKLLGRLSARLVVAGATNKRPGEGFH